MTSVQLCRFFGSAFDPQLQKEQETVQYSAGAALLTGQLHSGKTSLLFQYAYSYALENKLVIFICIKKKIQNALPLFPSGCLPDPDTLQRIKMKYFENDRSLRSYLASIHLQPQIPHLIIVDDIAAFMTGHSGDYTAALAKTLAFLKDAAEYCTSRLSVESPSSKCILLVSDFSVETIPRHLFVFQRWLPLILTIQGKQNPFLLVVHKVEYLPDPLGVVATFNVYPNSYHLQSLEFNKSTT